MHRESFKFCHSNSIEFICLMKEGAPVDSNDLFVPRIPNKLILKKRQSENKNLHFPIKIHRDEKKILIATTSNANRRRTVTEIIIDAISSNE